MLRQGTNAVLVGRDEIRNFANSWPCSGMRDVRECVKFYFANNGDLNGIEWIDVNTREEVSQPEGIDDSALYALSSDARDFLKL